jgi:1,4-dihydroxy-2-naphthoyl-CoA hydrolase
VSARRIWFRDYSLAALQERQAGTLGDVLGIVFTAIEDEALEATMPVDARTRQPLGIMHGGASAALAEGLASAASNLCLDLDRAYAVGQCLEIHHLRPLRSGLVRARATPLHLGRRTHLWAVAIVDGEGRRVSDARLTTAILPREEERR